MDEGQTETPTAPSEAMQVCRPLKDIVDFLKESDPIGRTGDYIGVYGLYVRSGGFTPAQGAVPVKGEVGRDEEGMCYDLITYAPDHVSDKDIENFCNKVAEHHPWEHPTIEIEQIHSWVPE